ncbi:hypothetical protein ACWCXH_12925 [Kitasatospora sp. NPDC001660]
MRSTSLPLPTARRLLAVTTAAAALTLGSATLAPLALAAPGDSGDIKIHDSSAAVSEQRDESKVCVFHLDASNFGTVPQVSWTIERQLPAGTAQVRAGSITLTNGTGTTGNFTLPDGHYKLEWTFAGENGAARQKVFDVSCATSSPSPSGSHSPSPGPTLSSDDSHRPSVSSDESHRPSLSSDESHRPSHSHSPSSDTSHSPSHSHSPSGPPHGGVNTGGGGTSGADTAEVIGGVALLVGAGGITIRAMRRRPGTNAES